MTTDDAPAARKQQDLTRAFLAILLMTILIGASFWILRPFLLSVIWAAMIVVATWPLMLRVQARLRYRWLAVTLMSGAMILVFVVPLALAIKMIVENTDTMIGWAKSLSTFSGKSPVTPPSAVTGIALPWYLR